MTSEAHEQWHQCIYSTLGRLRAAMGWGMGRGPPQLTEPQPHPT